MATEDKRPAGRGRGRRLLDTMEGQVGGMVDTLEKMEVVGNMVEEGETILGMPQGMMGKIIGKAGSMIREMRETSGASIEVTEADFKCTVTIRGGKDQRDKAVKMIGDLNNNNQNGFRSKDVRSARDRSVSPEVAVMTYKTDPPPAWGSVQYGSAVEVVETEEEKKGALIDWDNLNANREEMERQRWEHLPELFKNFYQEHRDVTTRSEEDVTRHRKDNNNIETYLLEMASNPTISLLDKYPHLRLLAKRRMEDVTKHGESRVNREGDGGRISLLGPGVGTRPSPPIVLPPTVPRTRVVAEELFAASVAADDDQWLQFQVEADVPAREQIDSLKLWLVANRPSTIARSAGVGWIAVKFKDKGKKVMEAKAAWDMYEGEKTMEVVNKLATDFHVMGGKWMCHLPSGLIDDVWAKLATALMCGGLGPSVYMVKVSPVEDIDPNLARGEHVICVYNTDYKDTEQVMRVENLMRSAGVTTILTYKPDIFSALGIYRNNKWGFRPTIYSSRVMLMEGKSKVETVGTNKWYYNTSKGLQYPEEGKGGSGGEKYKREGKENEAKNVEQDESNTNKLDKSIELSGNVDKFSMGRIEDLSTVGKAQEVAIPPPGVVSVGNAQVPVKKIIPTMDISDIKGGDKSSMFCMEDMEAMKMSKVFGVVEPKFEDSSDKKKSTAKKALKSKKKDVQVHSDKVEVEAKSTDAPVSLIPGSERKSEEESVPKVHVERLNESVKDISEKDNDKVIKPRNKETAQEAIRTKKPEKQKPAWLLKLEQLQLKSLDEMTNTG